MLEPIIYGEEIINLELAIKIKYEDGILRIWFASPAFQALGAPQTNSCHREEYEGQAAKDLWEAIQKMPTVRIKIRKLSVAK